MSDNTTLVAIGAKEAEKLSTDDIFKKLDSSNKGLTDQEAQQRLQRFGTNTLDEKRDNPWLKFLSYFWGPIPWMIEAAAILSAIGSAWVTFIVIFFLLVINGLIGFWEEHKAADALVALKNQLALKTRVLRDRKWTEMAADQLVPGDIIRVRLGDIIAADVKLLEGNYLSVDQSALTGESLPVSKKSGDVAYSGTIAKQGEMTALVTATGNQTFFGQTAKLVENAGAVSHFQKAVIKVGDFLIFIALGLAIILIVVELIRGQPWLKLLQFILILVVASIPIAMPAVLSVTMALGALALSRMKAIVSRLQSIEEMAGIDILCSDKTGTLTQNKLTLGDAVLFGAADQDELLLAGALASRAEDNDAIDMAVLDGLSDLKTLKSWKITGFTPFDPVSKRTAGKATDSDGKEWQFTKGAPQIIVGLAKLTGEDAKRADQTVNEMAAKGFRTLGVARSSDGQNWNFLGILPLFDPPRVDSKETIAQAKAHGIQVKMVTGDNMAIAKEIAGQLGLGTNIQTTEVLFDSEGRPVAGAAEQMEKLDGFAQVFPEHKYGIVKALQERGHLIGMTGDGVNDAPALKQAEVGIAVSGATDAARAAASLVLTAPGLSTIIKAVEEARRIFERMTSYTIYRIAMTIDIMVFVVLAMLFFNSFPLTAVMIVILALLDDIPIMTIAYDNTRVDPKPVRWDMHRVITIAAALGGLSVLETFGLLLIGKEMLHLSTPILQTLVFLQLVVGGHLMLFLTRTRGVFWKRPYPSWQLASAIVATQVVAVLICGFGFLVPTLPWIFIGLVWVYNTVWMIALDIIKLGIYRVVEFRARHQHLLVSTMNQPLHPFSTPK
ncbi:plasma-membrane proton-efflux P-type ATPase [Acidithiobacillus sp. MC6.1]|nr:plasma-membrane proton-efflux P-type ATPase [Acidithiobacillus sp. MC6.1]